MEKDVKLRVLELFSGIGGMHYALEASGIPGEIHAAVDINTTANRVYQHNHRDTKVLNNNIQKFTPKEIHKMDVNAILMSPPCQPYTRVGNKKDVDDARSNALVHICSILPELTAIDYILMENVKGFETSQARDLYIEALQASGFEYQEFLLSPTEIGVPNTRYRYYCLARKKKPFSFKTNSILEQLPNKKEVFECPTVDSFLSGLNVNEGKLDYLLSDDLLSKRAWLLDIVHPTSTNTRCFTKAYTHYAEGTGSVFCPVSKKQLDDVFIDIQKDSLSSDEKLAKLKTLELRYFMPFEVAKLMSFPDKFSFPTDTTNKQKYRVLGNSINVAVVGKLIDILCSD
ncbi:tRNA (cytosine(38)-C(5))-methyltransferase [Contarinia nasturtii]|uniref:tRNA (cytosine(38)-C(5))-methyltransferase n=1 Tax=Contarinia nasturtii TaxID=265458 RepID=UPI0012D4C0B4|nr:tRNA (cytosine(38)-C(5))-methyltransferase [Contarinia nasturtii]